VIEKEAITEAGTEAGTEAAADEAAGSRGFHVTPRQMFIAMAIVLALALIALIIYLLWFLAPDTFTTAGGDDRAGLRPLLVINGPGQGDKPTFSRPMGSTYGQDDRIYVSDTENDRIVVFDERGSYLFEFGGKGIAKPLPGAANTWEEGLLNYPLGIDADEDGNIYVADFRNDQIQVFDAEGEFIRRFPDPQAPVGKGSSGQEGAGIAVTDVAVHDGEVYATDAFQVFVFTTEGEFVRQFGKPGNWIGDLDHPNGIDVDEDGTLYVSDSNHNRVIAFDEEGEVLWTLGEPVGEIAEKVDNTFGLPRGLTVLEDGTILVVDAFEFELVRVSDTGEEIGRYGERGVDPAQMNFPNGVASSGDRILVADKENDRVQVLELIE
jgi:DNA-binding beta-propeller fold protein YncE